MSTLTSSIKIICCFFLVLSFSRSFAGGVDTCLVNDECAGSIIINNILSDSSFVCISGCNEYAAPDTLVANCLMGDFPTVWYQMTLDPKATLMNIEVHSEAFEYPSISLFKGNPDCGSLEQVFLTNGNLPCIVGADGLAKAVGTNVTGGETYFLAVSAALSVGGEFELCISTIADGSTCVIDRGIRVVSRSNPGPLEGPFDPAEKLRVCFDVNSYTAAGNDCQWFQGIVPVFGNGWDPAQFDAFGQPLNASVNDIGIGEDGNGVYGAATWDWFIDVGYHHNNPRLVIDDFDNNGRREICNRVYETNCAIEDSIKGGCCGPCWDDAGDLLPGGWFAYGINGSCATPGPPIAVDWGDGNTCGCCMGPWKFCFDLVTRDVPDCLGDSTKHDLTLGFFTFADGEIGSWMGGASVCAYDQPLKLTLNALCGRIIRPTPDTLPNLNSEDLFTYQIQERAVDYWEWNISPYWAVPYVVNTGKDGYILEHTVYNTTGEPLEVTAIFIGHVAGSEDVILKKVVFTINPWTTSTQHPFDNTSLKVFPNPATDIMTILWPSTEAGSKHITIYDLHGTPVKSIPVSSHLNRQEIDVRTLSAGVYFINMVTRKKVFTARMIKS